MKAYNLTWVVEKQELFQDSRMQRNEFLWQKRAKADETKKKPTHLL